MYSRTTVSHAATLMQRFKKALRQMARLQKHSDCSGEGRRRMLLLNKRIEKLTRTLNPFGRTTTRARLATIAAATLSVASLSTTDAQAFSFVKIQDVRPATNATSAVRSADVEIDFSILMNAATLTSGNIRVYGSQTGLISNGGVFSGNPALTFNPTNDFQPGEIISVSVTDGVQGDGGEALDAPLVYSFTAAVDGGTAQLSDEGEISAGFWTKHLAIGDLNGDGHLDLLQACDDDGSDVALKVQLSDGNGSFTVNQSFDIRSNQPVLGDLDGDGDLDAFLPVSSLSHVPTLLLNNGDGSFTSQSFGSQASYDAAIGDLDGDGDLDIISGTSQAATTIWENNGDATFSSSTFNFGAALINTLAMGDLDGDGDLDVILPSSNLAAGSRVLLNNGNMNFSTSSFGSKFVTFMDLGDLDGDGDLDIINGHRTQLSEFWRNDGNGVFSSAYMPLNATRDIEFGDLDGDGDLDVFLAGAYEQPDRIMLNNGDGNFTTSEVGASNLDHYNAVMGDIDQDGDLDVLTAHYSPGAGIDLWLNASPGRFIPAKNSVAAACDANIEISFPQSMDTSTLTSATVLNNANLIVHGSQSGHITTQASISYHDDDTRVVIDPAAKFKPGEKISVTVTGAMPDGGTTATSAIVYSFLAQTQVGEGTLNLLNPQINRYASAIQTGDIDGDGDLDVVIVERYSSVVVLKNNGNAGLTEFFTIAMTAQGMELGDLDGDGDLDIALNSSPDSAEFLFNNGDGTFVSSSMSADSGDKGIALGDLDGDGDLDIVTVDDDSNSTSAILFNNGDGSFTVQTMGTGVSARDVAIGDLDGDCDLDIIIADRTPGNSNSVWFNNGDGTFEKTTFGHGGYWDVITGDLDNDGDLDAVLTGQYILGRVPINNAMWLNNGDGTFESTPIGRTIDQRGVELGDIEGDGDLDILITRFGRFGAQDASLQLLVNNGDATFDAQSVGSTNGDRKSIALGDLDGDGDLEVLTSSFNTKLELWVNGSVPQIQSLSSSCLFPTSGSISLDLTGLSLDMVTGASLTPPQGAAISLTVFSSTATTLATEIPAGSATTSGTYTLSLTDNDGTGSTTVTINARPSISGSSCGCPATALTYNAIPVAGTGDTDTWSIVGGTILSGQGTSTVVVEWNQGAADRLELLRTYADACTSTSIKVMQPKTLIATVDVKTVEPGSTTTIAVLNNDRGASLTLESVEDAYDGGATQSGDEVTYSASANFNGLDFFGYAVEDSNGCAANSSVVMVVGNTCMPSNLEFVERVKNNSGSVRGLKTVQNTAVSPDGKHLYAAGRNDHSIALFNRSSSNGTIDYVTRYRNGRNGVTKIKYVTDLQLSPDGAYLYASGYGNNALVGFTRDDTTGYLTQFDCVRDNKDGADGLKGASGLAVSPDGKHIYVAGRNENSIAVISRSGSGGTAELTFVQRVKDGAAGVDGIRTVTDVAVSPDGKHVYAAGSGDNAVAVFTRNLATGSLTYVERLKDKNGGVNGLSKAVAVKVSPDGRFVHVAANQDDAVSVFKRNANSGRLTYVEDYSDRDAGVAGMDGAADVAVGPDGLQTYVSGESDNAMAYFSRKPSSGELKFETRKKDGKDGVDGLRGAKGLEVSGDSKYIYVAGAGEHSVSVFYRNLKPIARDDSYEVMLLNESPEEFVEEESITMPVLNNDVEIDGDILKITSYTTPDEGSLSLNSDSTKFEYTYSNFEEQPARLRVEIEDEFTYTVSDGNGGSSTATVNVSIEDYFNYKSNNQEDRPAPNSPHSVVLLEKLSVMPNPSQGESRIDFRLNNTAIVKAEVRDITGRRVATLLSEQLKAGEYLVNWNGSNSAGRQLNSGTYYIVISANADGQTVQQTIPIMLVF